MKIYVFCCKHDVFLNQHPLFNQPNIIKTNLRLIQDNFTHSNSVILLSQHSTNKRTLKFIRQFNVLTPIYLISENPLYFKEINGSIHPDLLTFDALAENINLFPQKHIWDFVFTIDRKNRILHPVSNQTQYF